MFGDKKNWILYGVIIGLSIILFIIQHPKNEKKKKEHRRELEKYKRVEPSDSIFGRITSKYVEKVTAYVFVNDSIKYQLTAGNYLYKPVDIFELIEVGDTIYKQKNARFYFIYHQGRKYQYHYKYDIIDGKVKYPKTGDSNKINY